MFLNTTKEQLVFWLLVSSYFYGRPVSNDVMISETALLFHKVIVRDNLILYLDTSFDVWRKKKKLVSPLRFNLKKTAMF